MRVLYHLPVLPPRFPQAEALSQEIELLSRHFDGRVVYLNPNQHSPIYLPRLFFGFHRWRELRRLEAEIDLHHIYNPDPFPFPILRTLRRPVVYALTGGVGTRRPDVSFLNALGAVTVYDDTSLQRLQQWGVRNVFRVRTGIDVARFSYTPAPAPPPLRLMMGSAPWTAAQFESKGIDALLAAARQAPYLHLVLLWRGVLQEKITEMIRHLGLEAQVTLCDGLIDVNQVLAGVHAGIVLATHPGIVKAYPHSLLDALATGKPILVSRAIPMAGYVEQTGCGQVVEQVTPGAILEAVQRLMVGYPAAQQAAQAAGQRDFSRAALVESVAAVYTQAVNSRP